MGTQYRCGTRLRRDAVRASDAVNGIDHLEVGPDQRTLAVGFLHPLPGSPDAVPAAAPGLTADHVRIEGGVRVRGIRAVEVSAAGEVLTVTVSAAGDFSTYVLRLVDPDTGDPPDGFDPRLAEVAFSFKVDCPADFDCRTERVCTPGPVPEPEIDYLAKDYQSFRRLMLDRLAVLLPDWRDRSPADLQVALVELLAYVGDHLSYFQDAVATEAYLGTARSRVSLRRHARLLDYHVHDGCNARAWAVLEVAPGSTWDGGEVEPGTRLLSRGATSEPMVDPDDLPNLLAEDRPTVFETVHPVTVRSAHNGIRFHTWGELDCCLPAGATRATLRNDPPVSLAPGDLLLLEEVHGPTAGPEVAPPDPAHRHVVRLTRVQDTDPHGQPLVDPLDGTAIAEVAWGSEDALPFPLCLSVVSEDGTRVREDVGVARGNVVLADHGLTVASSPGAPDPVPDRVPAGRPYRPRLSRGPLTRQGSFDPSRSAAGTMRCDPAEALPVVTLDGDDASWSPRSDLLHSDRFAPEFVVEAESDGSVRLRFGDGFLGRRPGPGATFTARYRVGNGAAGNVGAETLTRVVLPADGITAVTNPLPARGGTEPEPADRVRRSAPHAFRVQQRAVVERDYAEVTGRRPGVQRAAATLRWTGSWYTVFVSVDRTGGRQVDAAFEADLRRYLDVYRRAGHDLEVDGPVPVPLDILLEVCVEAGHHRQDVARSLLAVLGAGVRLDSRRGFFHPDNLTFGQPVYLSQLYGAAQEVEGVAWVRARRFRRWGREPAGELEAGVLRPGRLEVPRLDNDPNFPENGRLDLVMAGGT